MHQPDSQHIYPHSHCQTHKNMVGHIPDIVVELSSCRCKTGCIQKQRRCISKMNNFLCTEMCLCVNCSNEEFRYR